MALATWKDLCTDAQDPASYARFWGSLTGRQPYVDSGGWARLDGERPRETVWVNPVPEPHTVKNRVHLDVRVGDLDAVTALRATVLRPPGENRTWWVLADPEGEEFCAFVRTDRPGLPGELFEVVVDAADPEAQARWWADVLGGRVGSEPSASWWWVDAIPAAPFESLVFNAVPEPKTVKNRVHRDVTAPSVADLVRRGARVLREPAGDVEWHVLADPEGNEFCAFPPA
ncbi:MAG: hypothetical protein M3P48_12040 [Actinomycetota bacterium]|nr:hypothetical protein [Actinomycetota bacterium]